MNTNSINRAIERGTGLKKSEKKVDYTRDSGNGNIAYRLNKVDRWRNGDFHIAKYYQNTFDFYFDNVDARKHKDDVIKVLTDMGCINIIDNADRGFIKFDTPKENIMNSRIIKSDATDDIIRAAHSDYFDALEDLLDRFDVQYRDSRVINGGRIFYIEPGQVEFKHPNSGEYVPLLMAELYADGSVYLSDKKYGGGWNAINVPLDEVFVRVNDTYINCLGMDKLINSSRQIKSSQKRFENVVEGTQYNDYHIDTRGQAILDVEYIIDSIESRGNQAVLTIQCSDGTNYHTYVPLEDWKKFKDLMNDSGVAITDVWVTEVEGGSYIHNSRKLVKSSRRITSARNIESANEDDVREIAMFIENDGQLYRQMIVPVIKNLERKVNKGDFDKEKALIAWQHVADEGTKKYNKEFGSGKDSVLPFNTATRKEVAKQLMEYYEENYMGDNPITSAKENKAEESGPHMQFKKLDEDKKAELREQIEDELEAQLNKLHVKFDVDTWDNTVEYILSFFEEDNFYNPKDAKQAVHEWYLDTKDEFPEMFEQDVEKKRIASALYKSRIQGKLIDSSKKPIKSSHRIRYR